MSDGTQLIADTKARTLSLGGLSAPCLIGKGGALPAADKREGDGATPLGTYRLGAVLIRPDRVPAPPKLALPWRWLAPSDGWADDPADPAYNRPVRHPHPFSAEHLWREDGLYDVIVTLDHNTPPVRPLGSAVFLHCTAEKPYTAGCVAVAREMLLAMLARVPVAAVLEIR